MPFYQKRKIRKMSVKFKILENMNII